jgi:hypothetical protein
MCCPMSKRAPITGPEGLESLIERGPSSIAAQKMAIFIPFFARRYMGLSISYGLHFRIASVERP